MKGNRRVLSIFSGCGGMDLGFEGDFDVFPEYLNESIHPEWMREIDENGSVRLPATGFVNVFANDIMPEAMRAWTNFFGKRRNDAKDVFRLGSIVDFVKMSRQATGSGNVFPDNIDVVIGGFPCNDFSVAGKRMGFESYKDHTGALRIDEPNVENRGQLYMWMMNVVEIVKPLVFVAENVKGLVSLGNAKSIIERDFHGIDGGYAVVPARVLKAVDYGVPQTRERIFFIGFRKDALNEDALRAFETGNIPSDFNPYPVATHASVQYGVLKPYSTVKTALKNLPEPNASKDLSHSNFSCTKFMGFHCQGQGEIRLNAPGPTIRAEHHGNIQFRRLSAENGGVISGESHLPERRLSVRECARIQTFPDDYEFVIREEGSKRFAVNASMGYKMIGNAVPPLLAYHIADRLGEIWEKIFRRFNVHG